MLSGLVGLTAPYPDGCRADKVGLSQPESWGRLRSGPVLVLETRGSQAGEADVQTGMCPVEMGRWGFTRERRVEGQGGRGRPQEGEAGTLALEVNRCLPGAVSAEGVAKHVWTLDPSPQFCFWDLVCRDSPDLSDLLHSEGILFRRSLCPPSHELTPSFSSSELMLPCQPLPAGIQAEMGRPDLSAAS